MSPNPNRTAPTDALVPIARRSGMAAAAAAYDSGQSVPAVCDPHEAAEAASVAFYGADPKTGWVTAASLQLGPHTPGVWTVPAVVDDEPEGLAWLPKSSYKTDGDT